MKQQANTESNIGTLDASNLFELIGKQCDLAVRATDGLSGFLETGVEETAEQVRSLEQNAERQRSNSLSILRSKFPYSPLREETHRAINSVIEIIHYAHTTVREMTVLQLSPDRRMKVMGDLIRSGTLSLQDGYARLSAGVADVEDSVEATRQAERNIEEAYRNGLTSLFDTRQFIEVLNSHEHRSDTHFLGNYLEGQGNLHGAAAKALAYVVDIFRRREILRHLSNTADRVFYAGNVLHEFAALASSNPTPVSSASR